MSEYSPCSYEWKTATRLECTAHPGHYVIIGWPERRAVVLRDLAKLDFLGPKASAEWKAEREHGDIEEGFRGGMR